MLRVFLLQPLPGGDCSLEVGWHGTCNGRGHGFCHAPMIIVVVPYACAGGGGAAITSHALQVAGFTDPLVGAGSGLCIWVVT